MVRKQCIGKDFVSTNKIVSQSQLLLMAIVLVLFNGPLWSDLNTYDDDDDDDDDERCSWSCSGSLGM